MLAPNPQNIPPTPILNTTWHFLNAAAESTATARFRRKPFEWTVQSVISMQAGDVLHGHIGIVNHKNTDLSYLDEIFWHFWQINLHSDSLIWNSLEKRSLNTDLLRKINQSSNLLTASIDVVEIIDHLVSSLEDLFSQKSGAILVLPPRPENPWIDKNIWSDTAWFSPIVAANTPGDVYNAIHGSSAFSVFEMTIKNFLTLFFLLPPHPGWKYKISSWTAPLSDVWFFSITRKTNIFLRTK